MNHFFQSRRVCSNVVWNPLKLSRRSSSTRLSHIIGVIHSGAGFAGRSDGVLYASAKAAQANYTRCLASQLRENNITVNMVAPGGSLSARFLATRQASEELLEAMDKPTLERYATPDEIAAAVQFFASPLADFVSGQILRVDGGSQLIAA